MAAVLSGANRNDCKLLETAVDDIPPVWVSTRAARRSELYQLLKDLGAKIETGQSPSLHALSF